MTQLNSRMIHVIAFDVPWPADYGGVIDVFHKIRSLHAAGVKVILHCFQYGRPASDELREVCTTVHYYPRRTGLASQLSIHPYIVRSRRSDELSERLLQDDYPILAEGLHSSAILTDPRFAGRQIFCRTTNVEHEYYRHLAEGERNFLKRWYFRLEAFRLKRYQQVLSGADKILAISPNDERYFRLLFGNEKVAGIYAFHQYDRVVSQTGRGSYFLYHGKLDVAENYRAVMQILPVFGGWEGLPLWVAGMNPPGFLQKEIAKYPAVRLVANPDPDAMQLLIRDAQGHVLTTSQPTGLKLKLLAALFQGRFAIVNNMMVAGTGLETLCLTGNTAGEIRELLTSVQSKDFSSEEVAKRVALLGDRFSNASNALRIISLLHP